MLRPTPVPPPSPFRTPRTVEWGDCDFLSPARPGDALVVAVRIERLGTSSIRLSYAFDRGAAAVARGSEVRVFVREADGSLASALVPEAVRAALAPLVAGGAA